MENDRWERIVELFHAAAELEPRRRDEFLVDRCAGDPELRDEVESLLRARDVEDGFLEGPAALESSDRLPGDSGESLVGERLGPYEIESVLGRGGMGVVYRARDTRLDRPVAIKALPPDLTRDERSRLRLQREARAVARLTCPEIATVHSLEEFGDDLYVVYEYVEGHTLRQEIAEGPLSEEDVLAVAIAVAGALAAAHDVGIVHRDVKPENVIRAADGGVKVLDFGLARFQERILAAGEDGTAVPDATGGGKDARRLTLPGVILGTPAYMSPEALGGRDVDFRADIFSFGVVLQELATGSHPFGGEDPVLTMVAILEKPPAGLAELEERSPGLARIVERCLRKDPAERYAETREMVRELDAVKAGPSSEDPGTGAAVEPRAAGDRRDGRFSPLWWWRFHQLLVGIAYYGMLVPLWFVKEWVGVGEGGTVEGALEGVLRPEAWAAGVFYLALVPVGVAGILRIHLWFTSRYYPEELGRQRRRAAPWIRTADLAFVTLLLTAGWLVGGIHSLTATILVAFAIGFLISATMIEPTTARAAFRDSVS